MAAQFPTQTRAGITNGAANGAHARQIEQGAEDAENDRVLIIGAGFAGIGMAIRLKLAGIHDFTILERAQSLGGTWRDNTYPGIACDVPSHLYSYSFEPNPNWSHLFAHQDEILAYLEHCADKYGVRQHIRFGSEVTAATFDEETGLWTVTTADGATLVARVIVSGAGHSLSKPVYPDIPGRETFLGKAMHSARWDHDYSLKGKTVAVIGTGASAIQIIPSIAGDVGRMHVFQRTASWVQTKPDRVMTDEQKQRFRDKPYLQRLTRGVIYVVLEAMATGYVVEPQLNRIRELTSLLYLRRSVKDPVLRAKLTPHFRLGCKRILISSDYYRVLQQENVELVTDGIAEIRPHSIVTRDGKERPVDAIVFATGFETSEAKPPFRILGRQGRDLADAWRGGISAYAGTTVTGFPNVFLLLGPNVGLGHSSMIFMMESQFPYVLGAIQTMRDKRLKFVDVRSEVEDRYNHRIQKRLAKTVWNSGGCVSWYLTPSRKNTISWPGFTFEFRRQMRRFDSDSYELVAKIHSARVAAG
jgi:cation diffusion facilitator CzcD-associated flavoprotein CzcO